MSLSETAATNDSKPGLWASASKRIIVPLGPGTGANRRPDVSTADETAAAGL